MIEFVCRFADVNVKIEALFEETRTFCCDYLTEENADFTVSVSWEDIEKEHVFARETSVREPAKVVSYAESYLETLAVYRKIAEEMVNYNTLLFHGSAIAVDGVAYLFTAKSGTGKSTHTRLWRKQFGDRAFMVNDDKPLIRITEQGAFVCGTPWDGKHHLSRNVQVPLKAICLLAQDETNHIERMSRKDAFPVIMQQIYRPVEMQKTIKLMGLLERLLNQVSFYKLGCNMEPEAALISYQGMQE